MYVQLGTLQSVKYIAIELEAHPSKKINSKIGLWKFFYIMLNLTEKIRYIKLKNCLGKEGGNNLKDSRFKERLIELTM